MTAMAMNLEMIHPLAAVASYRDPALGSHLVRIGFYCRTIAQRLQLPADVQELLFKAAPMHDLGKLAVPDFILSKQDRLDEAEFAIVKRHTIIGHELLKDSRSTTLRTAALIALTHHERYDGTGYPHRLKGNEIPLLGRICAVGDVFDALISDRPYKKAWSIDRAVGEIATQAGTQFDPRVVEAFYGALPDLLRLLGRYPDDRLRVCSAV